MSGRRAHDGPGEQPRPGQRAAQNGEFNVQRRGRRIQTLPRSSRDSRHLSTFTIRPRRRVQTALRRHRQPARCLWHPPHRHQRLHALAVTPHCACRNNSPACREAQSLSGRARGWYFPPNNFQTKWAQVQSAPLTARSTAAGTLSACGWLSVGVYRKPQGARPRKSKRKLDAKAIKQFFHRPHGKDFDRSVVSLLFLYFTYKACHAASQRQL